MSSMATTIFCTHEAFLRSTRMEDIPLASTIDDIPRDEILAIYRTTLSLIV